MDLSAPIAYGGLTVAGLTTSQDGGPSRGIVIERCDPVQTEFTGYVDKRAQHDGVDAGDGFLGGRYFDIQAGVYGTSEGDTWVQLDQLMANLSPSIAQGRSSAEPIYYAPTGRYVADHNGFISLRFFRPTTDVTNWPTATYPFGIPLALNMRATGTPRYTVNRNATDGQFAIVVQARMLARQPDAITQNVVSVAWNTSGSGGNFSALSVLPFWPTAVLDINSGSGSTLTFHFQAGSGGGLDTNIGYDVSIALSTASSGQLILYPADRIATWNGTKMPSLVSAWNSPAIMRPGTCAIRTTAGGNRIASTSQLLYRGVWP